MTSWFSSMSDTLKKRACRFLLHRYLGQFLKVQLTLEQLSLDLTNGVGIVNDINIDVQAVNDALESGGLPFKMIDGFIGLIKVSVPWKTLDQESCDLEIDQFEVTLQPRPNVTTFDNSADLVGSMIASMIGSMTSSMNLANQVVEQAETVQSKMEGIEDFAGLIDTVLSRARVTVKNVIVRLEYFHNDGDIGSALEMQCSRLDFFDDLLDESGTTSPTATRPPHPITVQPYSLLTIPDMNKVIHIYGLTLYTDVFSKPEMSESSLETQNCVMMTSMRLRRQGKKSNSTTPHSSVHEEFLSPTSDFASSSNLTSPVQNLESAPILLADFSPERQTVRLKLKNTDRSDSNATAKLKVDVECFMGSCHMFASPTQLHILMDIFSSLFIPVTDLSHQPLSHLLSGKPLLPEDYQKIENQFNRLSVDVATSPVDLWRTDLNSGNWAGEDLFYSLSSNEKRSNTISSPGMAARIVQESELSSVAMSDSPFGNAPDLLANSKVKIAKNVAFSSFEEESEQTRFKMRFSSLILCVVYKDPLNDIIRPWNELCASQATMSTEFLESCRNVSFGARTNFDTLDGALNDCCSSDCIRILAAPISIEYTESRVGGPRSGRGSSHFDRNIGCLVAKCGNVGIKECLFEENVDANFEPSYTEILKFNSPECKDEPALVAQMSSAVDGTTNFRFELGVCQCELDPTLLDRILPIVSCEPIYKKRLFHNLSLPLMHPGGNHLLSNLNSPSNSQSKNSVDLVLKQCLVTLRIPIPDLRPISHPDRASASKKTVRSELLRLELNDAKASFANVDDLSVAGSVLLQCRSLNGYFVTENCVTKFLHAFGPELCSLEAVWNFGNRALFGINERFDAAKDNFSRSPDGSGSYFKMPSFEAGAFSKKRTVHEDRELVIVGDKEELIEFSNSTMKNSNVVLNIHLPVVRLYLPDKQFYELLYNRLINDLAMWTPLLAQRGMLANQQPNQVNDVLYSVHVAGLQDVDEFLPCKSTLMQHSMSTEGETDRKEKVKSSIQENSAFSLKLTSNSAVVLVKTDPQFSTNHLKHNYLKFDIDHCELFCVTAFENDPDVQHLYFRLNQVSIFHANSSLDLLSPSVDAFDPASRQFGHFADAQCMAEPTAPSRFLQRELTSSCAALNCADNDRFSIAMKMYMDDEKEQNNDAGVKCCRIAIGVRHMTLNHHFSHQWIIELVDFFNAEDFPVVGFEPPRYLNELHLHGEHCAVQYKPVELPALLHCQIGSFDLSSNMVYLAQSMRLNFIFEDISLFLGKLPAGSTAHDRSDFDSTFVCIMQQGLFELVVTILEADDVTQLRSPAFEISIRNDLLQLRSCFDSTSYFMQILCCLTNEATAAMGQQESMSDDLQPPSSITSAATLQNETPTATEYSATAKIKITEMIDLAMEDMKEDICDGAVETSETKAFSSLQAQQRTRRRNDDEFCVVDMVTKQATVGGGGALTVASQASHIRTPNGSLTSFEIVENYFIPPKPLQDPLTHLPKGISMPLFRVLVNGVSVSWQLYGGRDFGELQDDKPYSAAGSAQPKIRHRFTEAQKSIFTKGGVGRDHSVVVDIRLNKISFLYDRFAPSECVTARQSLMIHDIEIFDRMAVSNINKMMYANCSDNYPRCAVTPMLGIRIVENSSVNTEESVCEASLKISMLPIRLNIDQDTLEFLIDFSDQLVASNDCDVMREFSKAGSQRKLRLEFPVTKLGEDLEREIMAASSTSVGDISNLDMCASSIGGDCSVDLRGSRVGADSLLIPSISNLSDSGDELAFAANQGPSGITGLRSAQDDLASLLGHEIDRELGEKPKPIPRKKVYPFDLPPLDSPRVSTSDDALTDDLDIWGIKPSTSHDAWDHGTEADVMSHHPVCDDTSSVTRARSEPATIDVDKPLYFTQFTFSPAVTIRLDYHGKRVNLDQGALKGLLFGLGELQHSELTLKEINTKQGFRGYDRLSQFVMNEWLNDIKRNQLSKFIGSVGPMHFLTEIAVGVRDLFWLPVEEYQEQGRFMHGLQLGARSFGVSTASAGLELAQRLLGTVHSMAEFAHDIVQPTYPPLPPSDGVHENTQGFQQPATVFEGMALACRTVKRGFGEMGDVVAYAGQEERARGRWALRAIIRQALPSAIKPVAILSQATGHILGGARNQLRPEVRKDDIEKWRND